MALIIDTIELLYTRIYDAFVIVSSDSDYTPLFEKCQNTVSRRLRRRKFHILRSAGAAVVLCAASLADGSAYLSTLLLYAGGAATALGFLLLRIANDAGRERDGETAIGPNTFP